MRGTLYKAFLQALAAPSTEDGTLSAAIIPGRTGDYISTSSKGQPFILLSCAASIGLKRPPICLQHLNVEFGIRFRVRTISGINEGKFVVISLREGDTAFTEPFFLAAETLVSALPESPFISDIEKVVRDFVELMAALSVPSSRAVTGLWAELWLISVAVNPEAAVAAWHDVATAKFDFAFHEHAVEVKASEQAGRTHDFSFEQLRKNSVPIRIASLKLRRLQSGTSISDLVDLISEKIGVGMRKKLVKNVFNSIGSAISETSEMRFDESFARTNLRIVAADLLPVPVIPDESPISAVRFRLNLDDSLLRGKLVKPVPGLVLLVK